MEMRGAAGCVARVPGLYKIFFYLKAFVYESIILLLPSPPAMPTLLQYHRVNPNPDYRAIYDPLPIPPSACHRPYNIGHGNIVLRPSQTPPSVRRVLTQSTRPLHIDFPS